MPPPTTSSMGKDLLATPPVSTQSAHFNPKRGNAKWLGNQFTLSGEGLVNYWYVPAKVGEVSYCVVHGNGAGDAYVISDQFGGCEYHELYNASKNLLAFLHVYRGDGTIAKYDIAPGWALRSVKRSAEISKTHGMSGSNWAFSCIDRSTSPPTVETQFIHVEGYSPIKVTGVDDGETPY